MSFPTVSPKSFVSIVRMEPVHNFGELSKAAAEKVLYETLIPACEAQRVKLTANGNENHEVTLEDEERVIAGDTEEYDRLKTEHQLFNVERIQRAVSFLDTYAIAVRKWTSGSYGLKHVVERAQKPSLENSYISNGDSIAAMLLAGHPARFKKRTGVMELNCTFKAQVIDPSKDTNEPRTKKQRIKA